MIIPEALWVPSAKDAAAQFAPGRVLSRVVVDDGGVAQVADFICPNDYVAYVTLIFLGGNTAGVTTVTVLSVSVLDPNLSARVGFLMRSDATSDGIPAGITRFRSLVGAPLVVLMPRERIRADISYSAPAANNIGEMTVSGVLIPRGNWQYE